MEVKEVLYMSKGDGEAKTSLYLQACIRECSSVSILQRFPPIPNSKRSGFGLFFGTEHIFGDGNCYRGCEKKMQGIEMSMPEIQFYLNDLPGNDFNTLFKSLSNFLEKYKDLPCFEMGTPGSFHGRLFPTNTMHLIHSSYSAHWLSKVPRLTDKEGLPVNKGKIYITKTSPPVVKEAYLAQFQEDFGLFLKSRSQEMIRHGRVMLIINGNQFADPTKDNWHPWELVGEAMADMVSQGMISEEKLDSFDVPFYKPSQQEVKDIVNSEGSFEIELLETFAFEVGDKSIWCNGEKLSKECRSFSEAMVSHHFGEDIVDKLYDKLTHIAIQDLATRTEPNFNY